MAAVSETTYTSVHWQCEASLVDITCSGASLYCLGDEYMTQGKQTLTIGVAWRLMIMMMVTTPLRTLSMINVESCQGISTLSVSLDHSIWQALATSLMKLIPSSLPIIRKLCHFGSPPISSYPRMGSGVLPAFHTLSIVFIMPWLSMPFTKSAASVDSLKLPLQRLNHISPTLRRLVWGPMASSIEFNRG